MSEEPIERFQPTGGRILGSLALAIAATVVVIGLVDRDEDFAPPVAAAALLAGILVWAAMLRPRVWATGEHLVMRNMLQSVEIPLAAIEQVAVGQVLAVRAGKRRFVSPAIGRTWRQAARAGASRKEPAALDRSYPDFVEERIAHLAAEARAKAGVTLLSDEQLALARGVRRSWAWPELIGLGLASAALVVALFV